MLALLLGLPLIHRIDRERTLPDSLAEALLLGAFSLAVLLVPLGLFVPWSRAAYLALIIIAIGSVWFGGIGRVPQKRADPMSPVAVAVDLITAVYVIGYVKYTHAAAVAQIDFINDWGLKGRVFFEHAGIDWSFLRRSTLTSMHTDYPIAVPLTFDAVSLLAGRWSEGAIGVTYAVFGVALTLLMRRELRASGAAPPFRAIATFVFVSVTLTPWVGLADAPFATFLTAGVLAIRRAHRTPSLDRGALLLGMTFLGCASLCKNEGIALIVVVAIALVLTRRFESLSYMFIPVCFAGAWQIVRLSLHLRSDLTEGDVLRRASTALACLPQLLGELAHYSAAYRWMFVGVGVALILGVWNAAARKEGFCLLIVALQLMSYVAAYVVTPHDRAWHIKWSWERLVSHVTPMIVFVAMVSLSSVLSRVIAPRDEPADVVNSQPAAS
ncbi:MAG: hypothetical protein QOC81_622 [Thermoanaerobaculia bacterium]|nr:hypothetical protein [Thermoanaerobaculia bacterium]